MLTRQQLLLREVYGAARVREVTFWFVRDAPTTGPKPIRHVSMITDLVLEVIRLHEAVDTGYPFVIGFKDNYTRKDALVFVRALSDHIDTSRENGNSDYVIEWWNRCASDAGHDVIVVSIAPPGICDLAL